MSDAIPCDCRVAAEWVKRLREFDTAYKKCFEDEEDFFYNMGKLCEILEPVHRASLEIQGELEGYIRARFRQVTEDRFLEVALRQAREATPIRP